MKHTEQRANRALHRYATRTTLRDTRWLTPPPRTRPPHREQPWWVRAALAFWAWL